MKRLISLITVLALAFSICTVPVNAATVIKVWDGSVSTSWYTGKKTSYDISTASQLAGLAKLVNSGKSMAGVTINLTADIVLNDTTNWENWYSKPPKNVFTPIGHTGNPVKGYYPFAGCFNGNGHSISGLYVKSYQHAGLFGYISNSLVTQVIIKDSCVIAYDDGRKLVNKSVNAGAITGIAENSVISRCENSGKVYSCITKEFLSGREIRAGGIAGVMEKTNLSEELMAAALAAGGVFYNPAIITDGSGSRLKPSTIVDCVNNGSVTASGDGSQYSGGILGLGELGTIKNCLSLQPVIGRKNGAIIGLTYNCYLSNCYHYDGLRLKGIGSNMSSSAVGKVKDNSLSRNYDQIVAKSFVKTMGSAFVYKKNDRPYLSCDVRMSTDSKSGTTVNVGKGKVTISWSKTSNAVSYNVCYLKSNGKYAVLTKTTDTTATLKGLKSGAKYTILIQAKLKDGTTKTVKDGKFTFTA
ncbi:MAG: hypothetical protein IJF18_01605 [Oscillospiraceae bacterium]|nr:hypothetical protein [Oscillospiraceae bacterium]